MWEGSGDTSSVEWLALRSFCKPGLLLKQEPACSPQDPAGVGVTVPGPSSPHLAQGEGSQQVQLQQVPEALGCGLFNPLWRWVWDGGRGGGGEPGGPCTGSMVGTGLEYQPSPSWAARGRGLCRLYYSSVPWVVQLQSGLPSVLGLVTPVPIGDVTACR